MTNASSIMALSAGDLQNWTRALTLQPRHHSGLLDWVTGSLRDFFPFERVFLAHGEQVAGQIQITDWLAHGYENHYFNQIASTFDLATRGALQWWLMQRQPFCIDVKQPPSFATPFELTEIQQFGLGRIAGHGVLNATSSAGTYFSFAGIPTEFSSWHLDALTLMAPVLNDLFLNHVAAKRNDTAALLANLTIRQTDIVRLIVRGKTDKAIAVELDIAEKTVRNQLTAVYAHLGVSKRSELMVLLR